MVIRSNKNIYLVGFSGTGKTSVGQALSKRLGWEFVDTDQLITDSTNKSIPEIFTECGEQYFRKLESEILALASKKEAQVISTGGGAPMDANNRRVMENTGLIICLEAKPETIHERLSDEDNRQGTGRRPMLKGKDPLVSIKSLKSERQTGYSLADWTIHTDALTTEQAAVESEKAFKTLCKVMTPNSGNDLATVVETSTENYPIWVGWGLLNSLGEKAISLVDPTNAFIIHDSGTSEPAETARKSLDQAGIETRLYQVCSGEKNKNLESASLIYKWLAESRAERKDLIVAVGGGMVGDLAGFVAATYMRGMPFIQVPTTLLAMVDASIGGKVAIDLPNGKNLVGSFHQPKFVLSDVQLLQSLPARDLTAGWAEAIKHSLILDIQSLSTFEDQSESIQSLDPDSTTAIIKRSVATKGRIVSLDEKETVGVRALLNYGHTIGHALESVTNYSSLLHGEAVSIGMSGAGHISNKIGILSKHELARQQNVLHQYGLPTHFKNIQVEEVLSAMKSDKKTQNKITHWILLNGLGNAITRSDISSVLVRSTLSVLSK